MCIWVLGREVRHFFCAKSVRNVRKSVRNYEKSKKNHFFIKFFGKTFGGKRKTLYICSRKQQETSLTKQKPNKNESEQS